MTVMSLSLPSQAIGYLPFQTVVRDPVPVDGQDDTRPCYARLWTGPRVHRRSTTFLDFGNPSRGVPGISDGNEGVQWNAGYRPGDGFVWLGVNLEGMRYDYWTVARLIERVSRPLLLARYPGRVARPDEVTVQWTRDAWQHFARPPIRESDLGPTANALDCLDDQDWVDALRGARECLDPQKQRRGRRKVPVTVLPSKQHPWERRVEILRLMRRHFPQGMFPTNS